MTKAELSDALTIARSGQNLDDVDDSLLFGYGLPGFEHVSVTIEAAAKTMRWQVIELTGGVNQEALNELADLFRYRVTILGA